MRTKLFSVLTLGVLVTAGTFAGAYAHAATSHDKNKDKASVRKAKIAPKTVAGNTARVHVVAAPGHALIVPKAAARSAALAANSKRAMYQQAAFDRSVHIQSVSFVPKRLQSVPPSEQWQETRELAVSSTAALVIDQNAGQAIYQKNADTVVPIASISKLMTAMIVLDSIPNLKGMISVSEDDVDYLRGSRSRLPVGAEMLREDAMLISLMSSENRATHALARHYPGGLSAAVSAMNRKAAELGMYHTHFEDPTGLSSNNVSTAKDLAKMVVAAYRYPLIREFSTTSEARIDIGNRVLEYSNTNALVKGGTWDIGLSKTGFIQEAGKCLVMQARLADKPVVIVLLDSQGKLTRIGDAQRIKRWMETKQVLIEGRPGSV